MQGQAVQVEMLIDIFFQAGPVGLEYVFESGTVKAVHAGGQADLQGVKPGWVMIQVDGEPYSKERFLQKREGANGYGVSFRKLEPVQPQAVDGVVAPGQVKMAPAMKDTSTTSPMQFTCQWCGQPGQTIVRNEVSLGTHIAAGALCLIGCGCGCCLIPYCTDGCKEAQHFCPTCNQKVAKKKFIA